MLDYKGIYHFSKGILLKGKKGQTMEKLIHLLKKPEFHALLYGLSLLLFNWPMLTIFENTRSALFYYLFWTWGVFIVVLFFVARSLLNKNGKVVEK